MSYCMAPTVKRLLLAQCLAGLVLACLLLVNSMEVAYSALLGAGCCLLPNLYLALRVYNLSNGRSAQSTLRAFYFGAAGKFVVTVALFIVAFRFVSPLNIPAMFGGFIVVQAVNWAAPLLEADDTASSGKVGSR
jgi:ATP synthase protein I